MKQVFTIKDFKAFQEQPIGLSRLTAIAGSNSVGKSSIIQALLLLRFSFEQYEQFQTAVQPLNIPVNGPFLMELGNTSEVIRKATNVSTNSKVAFILKGENEYHLAVILAGDSSTQQSYQMSLENISIGNEMRFFLASKFYYNSAERIGPRLKYEYEPIPFPHSGYKGERTFQILSDSSILVNSSRAFSKDGSLRLNSQVFEWLEYIIPGANFNFAQKIGRSGMVEGNFGDSLPTNVGFGISYVLPIIVNGLLAEGNSVMIVENPEAHLHPSAQSRIGEFLSLVAATNVQVIIETHSEHVINGIRIAVLRKVIDHGDVVINFLSRDPDDKLSLDEISMTAEADLSKYPAGFFDQEERDLAKITRLRRKLGNE